MDLKQFVSETLVQISEGIEAAQHRLREAGSEAVINTNMTKTDDGHMVTGGRRQPVEFVEFDVAILANEGTETKAGIGLAVASLLRLDAGGKSTESAGRESRIKFRVPMSYPMHKYPQAPSN
jgi:predicted ATP-dependent Lon-type protease